MAAVKSQVESIQTKPLYNDNVTGYGRTTIKYNPLFIAQVKPWQYTSPHYIKLKNGIIS